MRKGVHKEKRGLLVGHKFIMTTKLMNSAEEVNIYKHVFSLLTGINIASQISAVISSFGTV